MRLPLCVLLLAAAACQNTIHDPASTGVRIRPSPGRQDGPVDLLVINNTGETLSCQVTEQDDACPGLPDLDMFDALPAGERWEVPDVTCADVELVCLPEGAPATVPPTRVWRWLIVEPTES